MGLTDEERERILDSLRPHYDPRWDNRKPRAECISWEDWLRQCRAEWPYLWRDTPAEWLTGRLGCWRCGLEPRLSECLPCLGPRTRRTILRCPRCHRKVLG